MRHLNFLEAVGLTTLALPLVTVATAAIMVAAGWLRVYKEPVTLESYRD